MAATTVRFDGDAEWAARGAGARQRAGIIEPLHSAQDPGTCERVEQ